MVSYKAKFKKASLIPNNKFTSANWFQYFEYQMAVDHITNNLCFNFVDEKHVINHNGVKTKVKANPITGEVGVIFEVGNFHNIRNLVATISFNPCKKMLLLYHD